MNAIEVIDFTKRYHGDKPAVQDLNLTVPSGCFFGFVGPNGAGKTTTVNYIAGLIRKSRGTLKLFGDTINEGAFEYKRRIGVVLEKPLYLDRLTGVEYLHFVGQMYGLDNKAVKSRTDELLNLLDINDSRGKEIRLYSAGMKKKISFAAALIHDPKLLVLDEPFEGIDAVSSRQIKDNLLLMVEKGRTIILTSHVLDLVEKICNEVAIIDKGKIVFQCQTENIKEILKNNSHDEKYADLEDLFLSLVSESEKNERLSWL